MKTVSLSFLCCAATIAVLSLSGCKPAEHHEHAHDHEGEHEHGHKAAHGGCLNALGTCENGHAEARLADGTLELWFVGGGSDTEKAVRIPDVGFTLAVTPDKAAAPRPLGLAAVPGELSEEKVGDCSHFVGKAEWLKGVAAFTAVGEVTFRGRKQAVRIEYPNGYDPD